METAMPSITANELAAYLKCPLTGDGDRVIESCNTLAEANERQVSLFHMTKYAKELETTRAGVVILPPGAAANVKRAEGLSPLTYIEAKNTYYAWTQALVKLMGHRQHPQVGISPLASIHPSAKVGENANIHPYAVIGENVTVGANVNIFSHVTLMVGVSIGDDTTLYPGVTVYERCKIGNRCLINAGAVIGSDGIAYATHAGVHHKVPQSGIVVIEDDVDVAPHSIIERGVLNPTVVQRGTKMGALNIIGHNCNIGPGNMLISQIGMAGSCTTGKYVVIAGQAGITGHVDIPDFCQIGAQSGIMFNPDPTSKRLLGTPAMDESRAKRVYISFMKLPELVARVQELEKQVEKLKGNE
jgi:UDP-3-O-[3-hydroxymyristoyl] glucosamine N-acyltransferase